MNKVSLDEIFLECIGADLLERALLECIEADSFTREMRAFESAFISCLDGNHVPEPLPVATGPNETSLWIAEQGTPFIQMLVEYLNKKLPRSAYLNKSEDHVSKFLEDLIRRDSIGKRNRKGKKTYMSQVKSWALKNAHTQNRDAGVDGLTRCMHGALTRKEWAKAPVKKEDPSWTTIVTPKGLFQSEANIGISSRDSDDDQTEHLVSTNNPETIWSGVWGMKSLFDEFQTIFEEVSPEDSQFHIEIIQEFFVENRQIGEISEMKGVPRSDITNALMKIRRVLKNARKNGVFSEFGVQA